MTDIIDLLVFEEGFRDRPYLDSEGYPTVGIGFLLARTKCTPAELKKYYDFTLPLEAARVWLDSLARQVLNDMVKHQLIASALNACFRSSPEPWATNPRVSVLLSMAYQLGAKGLAGFRNTLWHVASGRFDKAADSMLLSRWAKQTPNRAKRHAGQMSTGTWCEEYTK